MPDQRWTLCTLPGHQGGYMTPLDANKQTNGTATISTLDWHHDMLNSHRYSACNFHWRPTAFKLGSSFCIPHFHVSHTKISSGSLGNGASFKYLIFILTQKVQNSFLPDAQGQIQAWEFIWEDGFKKSLKKSLKRNSRVDVKNILIVLSWSKGRPKTQ